MSGGNFNYLCYAELSELLNRISDLEDMERELTELGYTDIAKDTRRLIEYCISAKNCIGVLFEQLNDVFYAVEWYRSADIGKDSLLKHLEKYRIKDGEQNGM